MSRTTPKPTIVVVGAGFAGLAVTKTLLKKGLSVILVDKNNYHLFQPLLYQVAAAFLAPEEIAKPVRAIFRKYKSFSFIMGEVTNVDFASRRLETTAGEVTYDYLILAPGARPYFFGNENLAKHSLTLKYIEDGIRIRSHVITCFERATIEQNDARRRALLTFAIGGAGSAGVEMAGALAELVNQVLSRDFPAIRREDTRILLLEGSKTILPDIPSGLSERAIGILKRKGVETRLDTWIEDFDGTRIRIRGRNESIESHTLIWTGGINAASIVEKIIGPSDKGKGKNGRIVVSDTLQLDDHPEVYVIGDAAHVDQPGFVVPMVAPAAVQMAKAAAENILLSLSNKKQHSFIYKNLGALATIGRNAAVADIKNMRFSGFPAWALWLVVHLMRLIGFRNRLVVLISWIWDYVFFDRTSRLIFKQTRFIEE